MVKKNTYRYSKRKLGIAFIFLTLIPGIVQAQLERNTYFGFLIGMNAGLNFTQLEIDSANVSPQPLPAFGLNIEKEFAKNISARFSIGYARRGGNSLDNLLEYRNDYFDMQLLARLKLGDRMKIFGGIQRSGLLDSYVRIYSNSYFTDFRTYETSGFMDQWEWQAGLSVALTRGMDFEFHYRMPTGKYDYHTFQFGVNVYLSELRPKKRLLKFTSLSEARNNPFAVEKLVLHRQNLKKIPRDVFSFTNLQELVLDGNQISELPPEVKNLKNLKILSLQFNELTTLPPEIGQLKKLEELRLHHNDLKELPKEIGQLSNLKFLYIGKNSLQELPEELGLLLNLIELDIAHSGILLTLPSSLYELERLEKRYIDQTTRLPYSIVNFNPRIKLIYK